MVIAEGKISYSQQVLNAGNRRHERGSLPAPRERGRDQTPLLILL